MRTAGGAAKAAGFSLHAGVTVPADARSKLESQSQGVALLGEDATLCHTIARGPQHRAGCR